MRDWKAEVARAEPMLTGAAPYDEAELRRILGSLVADSQDVEAGMTGASAQALDIKSRFSQFEADAAATLQSLGAQGPREESFHADARRLPVVPRRVRELARPGEGRTVLPKQLTR